MTTFTNGRRAETVVAEYLRQRGFRIMAQNWRTRRCEIDVVAAYHGVIYCVEVKYRRDDRQGGGLTAVTARKLHQMQYAARTWVHYHQWVGDYRLMVAVVQGSAFRITKLIAV